MEKIGKLQNSYWLDYYNKKSNIDLPSDFAKFISQNFSNLDIDIVDLCCGDGRDSFFLSHYFNSVTGIDFAVKNLDCGNVNFHMSNVSDWIKQNKCNTLNSYIRFALHSVDTDVEDVILNNSKLIMAEFRSEDDDSYDDDHFRRKINGNSFISKLINGNFRIKYYIEGYGMSVYQGQDPLLIRVVAEKTE